MPPQPLLVLVSMFAAGEAGGVQAFHLDAAAGTLAPAATTRGCPNSFFLAVGADRRTVYALSAGTFNEADTEEVTAWRLEPAVGPEGRTLLLAHYTGGTVGTLPLDADGRFAGEVSLARHAGSGADPARQEGPHPHAIVPAPRAPGMPQFVYAPDLGCDAIFAYRLDATGAIVPLDPPAVKTPPASGPRHLAFHPDGRRLYAINELGSTIAVYDYDSADGRLAERQVVRTLPEGFSGASKTADVTLTPDGRFVYGTNRGHDSIAVFRVKADGTLDAVEIVPSRGRGPQNLAVTPDGTTLLCANMPGNCIAVFRIDRVTGRLTSVGDPVPVASPSCVYIVQ